MQKYALWLSSDQPAWDLLLCIHDGKHYTLIGDPAKVQIMGGHVTGNPGGNEGLPHTRSVGGASWVARRMRGREVLGEHTWTEWEALYKKVNEAISEAMTEMCSPESPWAPRRSSRGCRRRCGGGVRERLKFLFEDENGSEADT